MSRRNTVTMLEQKIRTALEERGMSVAELARRLANGEVDDPRAVNDKRAYIYRWMRSGGISDEWAERLAATLDLPPDYFKTPRPQPSEVERLRLLASELLAEVEELQKRLDAEAGPS